MEQLLTILVNNGAAIGLLAYFIYRDNKFMNELNDTLAEVRTYLKLNIDNKKGK
jgi:hypothetical protein